MKLISKQCPNGHGAMHRAHIKITKEGTQAWHAIPWLLLPGLWDDAAGLIVRVKEPPREMHDRTFGWG